MDKWAVFLYLDSGTSGQVGLKSLEPTPGAFGKENKKAAYGEYRAARKEMQEIVTIKANIDHLFSLTDVQKNKEIER